MKYLSESNLKKWGGIALICFVVVCVDGVFNISGKVVAYFHPAA